MQSGPMTRHPTSLTRKLCKSVIRILPGFKYREFIQLKCQNLLAKFKVHKVIGRNKVGYTQRKACYHSSDSPLVTADKNCFNTEMWRRSAVLFEFNATLDICQRST